VSRTICIFEDSRFVDFFPLTLAQPVFDLRLGAGTLRSRWMDLDPKARVSFLCRDYLVDVLRASAPEMTVNVSDESETLFVNARWLTLSGERDALLAQVGENTVALQGGSVVAARVAEGGRRGVRGLYSCAVIRRGTGGPCVLLKSQATARSRATTHRPLISHASSTPSPAPRRARDARLLVPAPDRTQLRVHPRRLRAQQGTRCGQGRVRSRRRARRRTEARGDRC
jgi:hypothetical protein